MDLHLDLLMLVFVGVVVGCFALASQNQREGPKLPPPDLGAFGSDVDFYEGAYRPKDDKNTERQDC
jgi:hypothetical protein